MDEIVKHRPGIFKQSNKAHKTGRHRSKGLIDKDTKGLFTVCLQYYVKCMWLQLKCRLYGDTRGLIDYSVNYLTLYCRFIVRTKAR